MKLVDTEEGGCGGGGWVGAERKKRERDNERPDEEEVEKVDQSLCFSTKTLVDSAADVCLDVSFEASKRFIASELTLPARGNGLARVGTRRESSKR